MCAINVLSFCMTREDMSSLAAPKPGEGGPSNRSAARHASRRAISRSRRQPTAYILLAQIRPFLQVVPRNLSRINSSEKILLFPIPLISGHLKSTRINTSGNKDLKSFRNNTSGTKDLKSFRINTSKKHGRGAGGMQFPPASGFSMLAGSRAYRPVRNSFNKLAPCSNSVRRAIRLRTRNPSEGKL
jgi:hypothetical protein